MSWSSNIRFFYPLKTCGFMKKYILKDIVTIREMLNKILFSGIDSISDALKSIW